MNGYISVLAVLLFCTINTIANFAEIPYEDPIPHPNCPEDEDPWYPTHLPYPGDCNKFYKCLGGLAFPQKCPAGLHWSIEDDRCEWPGAARPKCNKTTSTYTQLTLNLLDIEQEKPVQHPDCPANKNSEKPTHLKYPGDCGKFYKCFYGYAYAMSCPPGLHWCAERDRCDYPNVAKCKLTYYAADEEHEKPIQHPDCPKKDDPFKPKHLPYPDNCTKFYKCVNGWAYPISCPKNQHFGVELDRCDWPEVAQCNTITTEEPSAPTTNENTPESTSETQSTPQPNVTDACKSANPIALLPHPRDCTKYIQCDYGRGFIHKCPSKLHFSVRYHRCEWPEIANCTVTP